MSLCLITGIQAAAWAGGAGASVFSNKQVLTASVCQALFYAPVLSNEVPVLKEFAF